MLKSIVMLLLVTVLGGCFPSPQQQAQSTLELNSVEKTVVVNAAPEPLAVTVSVDPPEVLVPADIPEVAQIIHPAELEPPKFFIEELVEPALLPYFGDFPLSLHPRVDKFYQHYTGRGRNNFARWLQRAGRYVPMIQQVFAEKGVPLDLAYLAMIESGFNVRAYSWAHAAGPWQFIEGTAKIYGMKNDWWQDERCDIEKATYAAAQHLKYLHQRFDGDWYLAVAAYNAGGGKVRKAIRVSDSRDFWELTEGKVLREETRNYLPKLIAALMVIKDQKGNGFAEVDFYEPLAYDRVSIPSSTDLEVVARLCDVDYATIKDLNPSLKRWSTPPAITDFQLNIPAGATEQFQLRYAELPVDQRARYHRHQINSGDTLGRLAEKYRIQIDDIITLNNIKNPRALKVGRNLILPLQENFTSLPVDSLADNYARSTRKTYTVRSGDSLWKIAKRFAVTEKQLRVWNRLGWSNLLRPGQKLAVAKPGKKTSVAKNVSVAKKVVYQVQSGDTLWEIGRQFDVELEMIRLWNDLSRGHILRPGQKLTLMVSATQRG